MFSIVADQKLTEKVDEESLLERNDSKGNLIGHVVTVAERERAILAISVLAIDAIFGTLAFSSYCGATNPDIFEYTYVPFVFTTFAIGSLGCLYFSAIIGNWRCQN